MDSELHINLYITNNKHTNKKQWQHFEGHEVGTKTNYLFLLWRLQPWNHQHSQQADGFQQEQPWKQLILHPYADCSLLSGTPDLFVCMSQL